ncbi:hypothetical protein GCM10009193_32350 [Shewanella aestuarii]|nr:hypothetical protein GCM10009193_32350 [Shewanella aestuarii]
MLPGFLLGSIYPNNLKIRVSELHRVFNTRRVNAVMLVPYKLAQQRSGNTVKLPEGKFYTRLCCVIDFEKGITITRNQCLA